MGGMTPAERAAMVRGLVAEAGFARVGIAVARPVAHADYFHEWLDRGCAGEMGYLERWRELRVDPRKLLPHARSVIVVGYRDDGRSSGEVLDDEPGQADGKRMPAATDGPRGRVARYACGRDYHRVIRKMLRRLVGQLHRLLDEPFETRVCVDTAPIIEREAAAAAGIGWIGKNTMLIEPGLGSTLMLGEVVTTLELEPSASLSNRCGSCTRCLDACPTGALIAPYRMDASRCIAYLTIEHRSEIPASLQPLMGDWVFGCDLCQSVCPYNRKAAQGIPADACGSENPLLPRPLLSELLALTEEKYRACLAGSPMKRATLEMLKRNAAIALANASANDRGGPAE
jgi:epoxyqueuosine reductase